MLKFTKRYAIFFILGFALFLRLISLDRLPTGISFDELEYVLNAKAVFVTHSDIEGKWNPLSLTTPSCCFPQAELPAVITSAFIGPFPLSLPFARLPYVLVSIISLALLYLISKKLLNQSQALVITLVATINPWNIFFARTSYDAPLATLLLLLAIYLLLTTKGWKILFAVIPLFLSFFTYIGMKAAYPFFILFLIPFTFFIFQKRKFGKWYAGLFLVCLIPLLVFFINTHNGKSGRINEISTPNQTSVTHDTNVLRQMSLNTPFKNIFVNRYTIFSFSSFEKYVGAFNPNFLFFHGDNKFLFTVWYIGAFYYTDIFFLLLGLAYLFAVNKKVWAFITGLTLLSPIPSVVSNVGTSYAIRSFPMLFFLSIFIGLGIYASVIFFKNKLAQKTFITIIALLYIFQICNFFFIYALVNPVANSESFAFSNRVLARYVNLSHKNHITFIAMHPQSFLKQYVFYNGKFDIEVQNILKELNTKDTFVYKDITFTTCNEFSLKEDETIILESGLPCLKIPKTDSVAITRLSDAGSIFTIYNDHLCSQYNLNSYPQHITFSDLALEKLSEQRFCQQFITKF